MMKKVYGDDFRDSTFVVSIEKWSSNKERTSSFVLNIYRNSSNDEKSLWRRLSWQYFCCVGRKMSIKQRANIKFYFKLGKSFTETHQMMKKVYGDDCLYRIRIHEWLHVFKSDGRLWKTMNVRAGQEILWTKKTRKLCVNSSEKSRNHCWNTWNRN